MRSQFIAMLAILPTILAAQVPLEVQATRCDALVLVRNELGQPLEAAVTFVIPLGRVLHTVYTDSLGVAYCGDRDSELSVFAYGRDAVAFHVTSPGYRDVNVVRPLDAVQGTCPAPTKVVETFGVTMIPTTGPMFPPTPVAARTVGQQPVAMCQYREDFVRSYTAMCHESTANYASVYITHGVCASPVDWSNSTSQTQEYTYTWSDEVTSEATASIEKVLGSKLSAKKTETGKIVNEFKSTVLFQGKLGVNAVQATLCGYSCMNATQRIIVTQRMVRCCLRQNGFGCIQWGEWRNKGPETETRVSTGYCTTESALFPCATPPNPIPSCAR